MTKKILTIVAILFALSVAGCASRCDSQRMGLIERFQNRPRPLRDWFSRGSECNNCNTHAGQIYGDMDMGFAGGQCQDGLCGSGIMGSSTDLYGGDQMGPIRSSYPDYSGLNGLPSTIPAGPGGGVPRSNGELEMPPMYGNGR